jgi:phage-related minor tail protein
MSKNINKRATKRKSAMENSIFKFLTVSSVSSDSIVKGIIDDIIKTAVKTAEVEEQKTKYLQHFINIHYTIVSN